MLSDGMIEDLTSRLYKKNVQDLRGISRAVGVASPKDGKKDAFIELILAYAKGVMSPAPRSARGAPPKSREYDVKLVDDIEKCREYNLTLMRGEGLTADKELITVSDGLCPDGACAGIMERGERVWYIRVNGCRITAGRDVTVQESFVTRFNLREGDYVVGIAEKSQNGYTVKKISSVNGFAPDSAAVADRINFADLTSVYPDRQLFTSTGEKDLTGRMIDFFTPLGAGQRAIITGDTRSGKTQLLKSLGKGICKNYPKAITVALLLETRPEEESEFRKSILGGDVFTTGLEDGLYAHMHAASLALKYAKRHVEAGLDVVLLVDGLNKLVRDGSEYSEIIKLLAAAGNFTEGGSLTVIGVINGTSGALYDAVCSAVNMCVALSQECAFMRIFPAIDLKNSYSAKPELVVNEEQLIVSTALRTSYKGADGLYAIQDLFLSTPDNGALIRKLKD